MSRSQRVSVEVCGNVLAQLPDSSSSEESSQAEVELATEKHAQPPDVSGEGFNGSDLRELRNASEERMLPKVDHDMIGSPPLGKRDQSIDPSSDANTSAEFLSRVIDGPTTENAFGIAYQPQAASQASSKRGYVLPARPTFQDEAEFEKQVGAEFLVEAGSTENADGFTSTHADGHHSEESDTDDSPQPAKGQVAKFVRSSTTMDKDGDISIKNNFFPENVFKTENISKLGRSHEFALHGEYALKRLADDYQEDGPISQEPRESALALGIERADKAKVKDKKTSAYFVEDVRRCPVIEEGAEDMDIEDNGGLPYWNGQRAKEIIKTEQRELEKGKDSQRALVAEEWDAINQLRTAEGSVPMERGVGGTLNPVNTDGGSRVVDLTETMRYFRSQDLSRHQEAILPFQPRWNIFRRTPKLKLPNGERLRDEAFLLAEVKYTPNDGFHRRLIQTIYRKFMHEERSFPDCGPHWDTIGFQGKDPSTDLNRSMGIFSLVQVLHLLETQAAFAAVLYRASREDVTGWPLLCVSIGFTKEAVGVLRRGTCYPECNRVGSVMRVIHELHHAQFHAFLGSCRKEPAIHHAIHLAKVRDLIAYRPRTIVKAYRSYISDEGDRKATNVATKINRDWTNERLDFISSKKQRDKQSMMCSARKVPYVTDAVQES